MLMRYLKITAQNLNGNGRADTVRLHFYTASSTPVFEAVAIDITDDGTIELACTVNITPECTPQLRDQQNLKDFAEAYLQLNWFNDGDSWVRHLRIEAKNYHGDGSPNVVTFHFTQDDGLPCTPVQIKSAAAYDGDNDGHLDSFTNTDINADGIANAADKLLMRKLAEAFLAFRWFEG